MGFLDRWKRDPDRKQPTIPDSVLRADAPAILEYLFSVMEKRIVAGTTTMEIEEELAALIEAAGVAGYFKNYRGFPSYLGASVNDQTLHTPPSRRKLSAGDVLKIEFGIRKEGEHAFVAWSYPIGQVDEPLQRLVAAGKVALARAVRQVVAGQPVRKASCAIQESLTSAGYQPNGAYLGYRIGAQPTMPPQIPCVCPAVSVPEPLFEAPCRYAILVIAHEGSAQVVVDRDGWTVRSKDGKRSVMFSQMIEATPDGPRALTRPRS